MRAPSARTGYRSSEVSRGGGFQAVKVSGKTSDALFPPIRGKEEFIGYNMLEKLKKAVDEDIGEAFELRKRRRTFGQRAPDEGHDIHSVFQSWDTPRPRRRSVTTATMTIVPQTYEMLAFWEH